MTKPDLSTLSHDLLVELLERTAAIARAEGYSDGRDDGYDAGYTAGITDGLDMAKRGERHAVRWS